MIKFFLLFCKDNSPIPLGRIQLNGLNNLTKVGSILTKDFNEPSLYDLEEIQTPPEALISSSISSFSSSSIVSFSNSNFVSQKSSEKKKTLSQIDHVLESEKLDNHGRNSGELNPNNDWIVNEEDEDNESNNSGETNNEKVKNENEDGSNRLKKKIQHYQTLDCNKQFFINMI